MSGLIGTARLRWHSRLDRAATRLKRTSALDSPGNNPFISWVDSGGSLRLSHWTGSTWQNDNFGLAVKQGASPSAFFG